MVTSNDGVNSMVNFDKDVFTTFEVAKVCRANITSIKNWIEQGELKAFRTPGGHYRIEKRVLMDFLSRHEMPNPFLKRDSHKVMFFGKTGHLLNELKAELDDHATLIHETEPTRAALIIGNEKPDVLVVDLETVAIEALDLVKDIKSIDSLRPIQLIGVKGENGELKALEEAGYRFAVSKNEGFDSVLDKVTRLL